MFLGSQLQHDHWPRIHETPRPGHYHCKKTISWGEEQISMAPHDYWTTEHIMKQKSHLNKQPWTSTDNDLIISEKTFTSEALNPVRCVKTDLEQIAQDWTDLPKEQQSKLLLVLKEHGTLFLGKRGNWKDQPVTIEVTEGAIPIWAKPYPVPLKNCKVFKEEVYRPRWNGAQHVLSVEEIEEREWVSAWFGVPKKNGTIRLVINLCQLNRVLKQKSTLFP